MNWNVVSVKPISPLAIAVRFEDGAVTWPGDIDLAPDAMYREIKRSGEWVLR
jgi:hypothetical protein